MDFELSSNSTRGNIYMDFESSNNITTRDDLSLFFHYYSGLAMKLFKNSSEKDVPDTLS